ncbi:MAG: hypothetical protein AAFN92_09130 [Bacteroidota bacterium]
MSTMKRLSLFLVLLAGVGAFAAYQYWTAADLADQLASVRATSLTEQARNADYAALLAADSLLHRGDYAAATEAYGELAARDSSSFAPTTLTARLEHLRTIRTMRYALDTFRNRVPAEDLRAAPLLGPVVLEPVRPLPLEQSRPEDYDSLTFALRKAKMQIRNLEGQLQRSGSDYLTFSSGKGNDVHYVGSVRRGQANGRGVALFSTGSRYLGEWKNNQKHGTGQFYWKDGAHYEGEYRNDERHGEGTYHFPNGEVYVGLWENDLRHGEGIFYDKKGKVLARGLWREDELVAQQQQRKKKK